MHKSRKTFHIVCLRYTTAPLPCPTCSDATFCSLRLVKRQVCLKSVLVPTGAVWHFLKSQVGALTLSAVGGQCRHLLQPQLGAGTYYSLRSVLLPSGVWGIRLVMPASRIWGHRCSPRSFQWWCHLIMLSKVTYANPLQWKLFTNPNYLFYIFSFANIALSFSLKYHLICLYCSPSSALILLLKIKFIPL